MTAFDDPDVAMAGPKIVHPAGDIQTTGIRLWHGGGSAGGEERKDEHPTEDVDGVTGACMAIRRSVFEALGGFDTEFRNGYDDVDLCLSVRATGLRIRYVAESVITHHESASGPERWTWVHDNIALMNAKWGNR
jgi:GT2 family glycosyltransferase